MSFQDDFWKSFPKGTILPFVGDIGNVPQGWKLCNGQNGTVNLVDRLPMGTENIGQIGQATEGSMTHSHGFRNGQETGGGSGGFQADPGASGVDLSVAGHKHGLSQAVTDPSSSLPPVTRVYFIQKV